MKKKYNTMIYHIMAGRPRKTTSAPVKRSSKAGSKATAAKKVKFVQRKPGRASQIMLRRGKPSAASIFYGRPYTKEEARAAFDASDTDNQKSVVPVVNSLGNLVNINTYDSFQFTTSTSLDGYIILQYNPFGVSVAITYDGLNDATTTSFRYFSTLQSNIPSTVRSSRKTICVQSLQNSNNIQGAVSVLAIPNFIDYVLHRLLVIRN